MTNGRLIQEVYDSSTEKLRPGAACPNNSELENYAKRLLIFPPNCFSPYSEKLLQTIEVVPGVTISGLNINNLRDADDTF